LPDSLGRHFVRPESRFPVFALDLYHSRGAHRAPEYRDFEQLRLGDELVARKDFGQRRHIEPADVVRGEYSRPGVVANFQTVDADSYSPRPHHRSGPPARNLVVDALRLVLDAQQPGDDRKET